MPTNYSHQLGSVQCFSNSNVHPERFPTFHGLSAQQKRNGGIVYVTDFIFCLGFVGLAFVGQLSPKYTTTTTHYHKWEI